MIDFSSGKELLSFEFFPPKSAEKIPEMMEMVQGLSRFSPAYMTVTYGAGGTTKGTTFDIAEKIQKELEIPSFAHLTCISHHKHEIEEIAKELLRRGITNVLALRGDPPKDGRDFRHVRGNLTNARDLTEFLMSIGDFTIVVGGYPEVHPEAEGEQEDLDYLRSKIEAGAKAVVTQLFFEPDVYFKFCEKAKLDVPIIPGVMPISNVNQVKKFTQMCGASIPKALLNKLDELQDKPEEVVKFGTDYAIKQSQALLEGGAPGIHLYTLNKSTQAEPISEAIGSLFD